MTANTPEKANTRRVPVVLRLAPSGLAVVDRLAEADGISRSEWIRRAIVAAVKARGAA